MIKTQLKNSMLIRYIDNLLDKLLQFCSFPSVHHHSRLLSPTKLTVQLSGGLLPQYIMTNKADITSGVDILTS